MKTVFWALIFATFGCAGSSSAPPKTDPAKPSDESASPGTSETTAPASSESKAASARVIGITPSLESVPYSSVKIVFDNPMHRLCTVKSYTLTWSGGKKTIDDKSFDVPGGEKRQRSLRVHPNDGDLATLTKEAAKVEIRADCGGY